MGLNTNWVTNPLPPPVVFTVVVKGLATAELVAPRYGQTTVLLVLLCLLGLASPRANESASEYYTTLPADHDIHKASIGASCKSRLGTE